MTRLEQRMAPWRADVSEAELDRVCAESERMRTLSRVLQAKCRRLRLESEIMRTSMQKELHG